MKNRINRISKRFTEKASVGKQIFIKNSVFIHLCPVASIGYEQLLEFVNRRRRQNDQKLKSAADIRLLAVYDKNSGEFLVNVWGIRDKHICYLSVPGTAVIRWCGLNDFRFTEVARALIPPVHFGEYGLQLLYHRKTGRIKTKALTTEEADKLSKIKNFALVQSICEDLKAICEIYEIY